MLRTNNDVAARNTLRKLHVRWWHASDHVMRKFLQRINIPERILNMLPGVCNTCKVCREWQKPSPAHQTAIDIPDKFNEQIEADLMFVDQEEVKHLVLHMICRCTRWHAAREVPNKNEDTLLNAMNEMWFSIHHGNCDLHIDGESGITLSVQASQFLLRQNVRVKRRAPGTHANYAERRGALLRDAIHKIYGQLQEEGYPEMEFPAVLAEAVFAGNAMLSINGYTPYQAVFGRTPQMLPGINQIDLPNENDHNRPGVIAGAHRLRELAIQHMVEGLSLIHI